MARARNVRGVLIVTVTSVALIALVAAKWLLTSGGAGDSPSDPAAVSAPGLAAVVVSGAPATRPAPPAPSVRLASDVRRPIPGQGVPAATPAGAGKPAAWLDTVLSGSKTTDSTVLGVPVPTSIDLSAPSTPIAEPPAFGAK